MSLRANGRRSNADPAQPFDDTRPYRATAEIDQSADSQAIDSLQLYLVFRHGAAMLCTSSFGRNDLASPRA
jgi:hypothetical protein